MNTHHIHVSLIVEGLSKDGDNEHIDKEGEKESDRWLNEEIFVGLFYFLLIFAVDIPRLVKEGR